jgi:AcrR family transcriptional regulator
MAASRTPPKQLRGERLVEKVFASAAAEVARIGHQHISIEEVAARAGVNKTSIYRRWPTPDRLVLEMFERGAEESHSPPDTGSLRGDLVGYVLAFERLRREPTTMAILRMHVASGFEGELAELLERLTERDRQDVLRIFERGIARGELPRGASAALGYDLVHGVTMELTLTRVGDDADLPAARRAEQLVEAIILGLGSMALHHAGRTRPVRTRATKSC